MVAQVSLEGSHDRSVLTQSDRPQLPKVHPPSFKPPLPSSFTVSFKFLVIPFKPVSSPSFSFLEAVESCSPVMTQAPWTTKP